MDTTLVQRSLLFLSSPCFGVVVRQCERMEEFDLLGHLHDAESSGLTMQQQSESVQVLLWKKLEINGYLPAAREVITRT